MKILSSVLFCLGMFLTVSASATEVGVFYYPGWSRPNIDGWAKIKPFPDREPLLGWYKEGSDDITKKQLDWMGVYGINFIVYDWYWDKGSGVKDRTYAIESYIRSSRDSNVGFSILWANHTGTPESLEQFDTIVQYWIDHYFKSRNYKTIDGKPIVFIFSPEKLKQDSAKFGSSAVELLERARMLAKRAGLKGIYFIGSVEARNDSVALESSGKVYDALSAYNYHLGASDNMAARSISTSYLELAEGYKQTWEWVLKNTSLPYIVPLTSGWDKTPWGGSPNPMHDKSTSTPAQFSEHLKEAKKIIEENSVRTLNTAVICCWNEFGEGSYIEPTKKYGFEYLRQISELLK